MSPNIPFDASSARETGFNSYSRSSCCYDAAAAFSLFMALRLEPGAASRGRKRVEVKARACTCRCYICHSSVVTGQSPHGLLMERHRL